MIVEPEPVGRVILGLGDRLEQVVAESVVTNGAVKALDVRVLLRLSGLDVIEANAVFLRPLGQRLADILWPVVAADRCRLAPPFDLLIERAHDPLGGQGQGDVWPALRG